ncbi:hypothetical protein [Paenibacillus sp. OAS669]|uniref:hypothetical protein n=1 Tax=Paenibacillus sp. OAS669 TaxID=2663821 RepID=UPI001789B203|nr:hypothetical protein [Paenibacillus sp. OAS669]MBE1446074.1 hypothetical protein [Paenibacillus sp. OAS669]
MTSIRDSFNNNKNSTFNIYPDSRMLIIKLKDWKKVTIDRINGIIFLLVEMSREANDVRHIMYGIDDKEAEWLINGKEAKLDLLMNNLKDSIKELKDFSPILSVRVQDFYTIVLNWRCNFKFLSLAQKDYEREIEKRRAEFKEVRDIIEDIFDDIIRELS